MTKPLPPAADFLWHLSSPRQRTATILTHAGRPIARVYQGDDVARYIICLHHAERDRALSARLGVTPLERRVMELKEDARIELENWDGSRHQKSKMQAVHEVLQSLVDEF